MSSTGRAVGVFAAVSVLFGGTFVAAKSGLAYFPPLLFVSLRFDVAAVGMVAFVALTRSRAELLPRTRGDVAGVLATGVFSVCLANALLFVGQRSASSGVAAVVFSLNPILTPVFAGVLLGDERLSRRGVLGLLVGLLGVALVVDPSPASLLAGGFGKALFLAAAASAALGSVLVRRADGDLSSAVRTTWGVLVGAALTHVLSLATGESLAAVSWTPRAVLALGYVGVFAGTVAYVGYFALLDGRGAIRANLVYYLTPVVAALGGWALLGESVSALTLAGFLVVFVGFAVIGSASVDVRDVLPGGLPSVRPTVSRPMASRDAGRRDQTTAGTSSHSRGSSSASSSPTRAAEAD